MLVIGDCKPALGWLGSMYGSDDVVMDVLLMLSKHMCKYGYEYDVKHVMRGELQLADALSRNDMQAIKKLGGAGSKRVTSPKLHVPASHRW